MRCYTMAYYRIKRRSSPKTSTSLLVCAVACAGLAGCRLVNREPVARSVANCRQLSQRGISAMERGQWEQAETFLAEAIKSSPVDAQARRQYAEALWHRRAWSEAVAQMEQACKLAGQDPALVVRAGEMYLEMGRIEDARLRANQAVDASPQLAAGWALRGRVHQATGHIEDALADMHRAISYQRDDQQMLLEVSELYRQLNRPARALCTLQSLKETYSPGEEPQRVFYLEGLALAGLDRYDEAAESFATAIQRDPLDVESYYRLAEIQLLAGRPVDAQRSVHQALSLQPQHEPSRALSERIAMAQGPTAAAYRQ